MTHGTELPAEKKGVVIVSAPRTTSTLLMRVFAEPLIQKEIQETTVLLEPYSKVFYSEHFDNAPHFNAKADWPSTAREANAKVLKVLAKPFFVIKMLAYQCLPYMSEHVKQEIRDKAHVLFLLRSPEDCMLSGLDPYFRAGRLEEAPGFENGFVDLHHLFEDLSKGETIRPWVVHAEDVLDDPERVLSAYFRAFGLNRTFSQHLTPIQSDQLQAFPGFDVWGHAWYGRAFSSAQISRTAKSAQGQSSKYASVRRAAKNLLDARLPEQQQAYQRISALGSFPSKSF